MNVWRAGPLPTLGVLYLSGHTFRLLRGRMPIKKPVYQLQLELEIEQGEVQDDALQLSDRARSALDAMRGKLGSPKWLDEYFALREGGWNWRVAVYMAWASSPRSGREPKTQDELARMYLGLKHTIKEQAARVGIIGDTWEI